MFFLQPVFRVTNSCDRWCLWIYACCHPYQFYHRWSVNSHLPGTVGVLQYWK